MFRAFCSLVLCCVFSSVGVAQQGWQGQEARSRSSTPNPSTEERMTTKEKKNLQGPQSSPLVPFLSLREV